jgi:low affinity Fe/Cu permease
MLSDAIWWTRKSRIQAAERLLANDFHTQLILVWYSTFIVGASIYFLKFAPQSELATVTMVIYSVMILSMSLFMSGRNFKERGMLMKQCYEQLDLLYRQVLAIEEKLDENELRRITEEYQNIVNSSENHKEIDFIVAEVKLRISGEKINKQLTWYHFSRATSHFVFRASYLVLFYAMPLLVLGILAWI